MDKKELTEFVEMVGTGKTDPEMSIITGLTERQVKRRVQKAMTHYQAASRVYMVVRAAALGDIDVKQLARITGFVLLATATMFTPPRIAPKSAPKRHVTEQVVRRALPKYDIADYRAA